MKPLNGIVWAVVIVIVWAFAMAGYRHFKQETAVSEVADGSETDLSENGQVEMVADAAGNEESQILMLGKYPKDYWDGLSTDEQQSLLDEENQRRHEEWDEERRQQAERERERRNEQIEENRGFAEERRRELEIEDQGYRAAAREESRRNALARSGSSDEPGVVEAQLNYYRTGDLSPSQQAAWGEFESCTGRFDSVASEFSRAKLRFGRSYNVTVTAHDFAGVDSGAPTVPGGGNSGTLVTRSTIREYDRPMTCAEILRSATKFDQRTNCEDAQTRMNETEQEMREVQGECISPARRAGVAPGNVREILRLPR